MTSLSTRLAVLKPSIQQPTIFHARKSLSPLACVLLIAFALLAGIQPASAQTESLLYSFAGGTSDGSYPLAGVHMDSSGNLYGTTNSGGAHNYGTVYKLTPSGTTWSESLLYTFGGTLDAKSPYSGVILDSSGNLYGTTVSGGQGTNYGTFYEVTPGTTWTETALLSFPGGIYGQNPYDLGSLIQDSSGNFFGTLYLGGAHSQGAVFEITFSGGVIEETVIYSFDNTASTFTGDYPYAGSMVMDSSGNLYGTATQGGNHGGGVVFKLSPNGSSTWTETVLWHFGAAGDGMTPDSGLVMDSSGNLYGTTTAGGLHGNGTLFEISPPSGGGSWTESRLYSFGGTGDGYQPLGAVVVDSSGNLYGTTKFGGAHSYGTVFKMSPAVGTWTESWLYSLKGGTTDGAYPVGDLIQDSSGNLYGATWESGAHSNGAVFKVVP